MIFLVIIKFVSIFRCGLEEKAGSYQERFFGLQNLKDKVSHELFYFSFVLEKLKKANSQVTEALIIINKEDARISLLSKEINPCSGILEMESELRSEFATNMECLENVNSTIKSNLETMYDLQREFKDKRRCFQIMHHYISELLAKISESLRILVSEEAFASDPANDIEAIGKFNKIVTAVRKDNTEVKCVIKSMEQSYSLLYGDQITRMKESMVEAQTSCKQLKELIEFHENKPGKICEFKKMKILEVQQVLNELIDYDIEAENSKLKLYILKQNDEWTKKYEKLEKQLDLQKHSEIDTIYTRSKIFNLEKNLERESNESLTKSQVIEYSVYQLELKQTEMTQMQSKIEKLLDEKNATTVAYDQLTEKYNDFKKESDEILKQKNMEVSNLRRRALDLETAFNPIFNENFEKIKEINVIESKLQAALNELEKAKEDRTRLRLQGEASAETIYQLKKATQSQCKLVGYKKSLEKKLKKKKKSCKKLHADLAAYKQKEDQERKEERENMKKLFVNMSI